MKSYFPQARLVILGSLTLITFSTESFAQSPASQDMFGPGYDFGTPKAQASSRYFRLGALVGLGLQANFGVSGQFDISHSRPGAPGVGGVDHLYDDGYVRVDQTGNAQGYTSYWGYNSADQLSGNTLTMHSSQSFSAPTGDASSGDGTALGLDLAYGGLPWRHNDAYIGWEFGFGYLPVEIEAQHALDGAVRRTVHTFNTGGIVLPTAPYNGGSSGIGPTIHDLATALPDDFFGASLNGKQTLDADVFLFRLGPVLQWELGSRLALSVSLGAAVGFVSGDLIFRDTLSVDDGSTALNTGKESDTGFAYGGYLNGSLKYHVEEHGELYLSLQYMPMSTVTIEGGGRRAELDMMGSVFISAGLNWPF